ncbi:MULTISPECIES: hypothetical protein [unclassified Fusobacterium]|uniref:hypothetical protein n=1 Tax=unclassified Fusobacterium TaxID=2648384 RepID=UPI001B8CC020|nr:MULTISPECIES: hypothetical protein [unclassified Fusobacterium]MBR8701049.1 hypothetical protein [Fusobacterium sp. DD45]MBR8710821.1 hypothetical protein [Fusobacterium sp. DD28]MBR8751401.1 hypothetical protein [Fusobacterium sp. DD26]
MDKEAFIENLIDNLNQIKKNDSYTLETALIEINKKLENELSSVMLKRSIDKLNERFNIVLKKYQAGEILDVDDLTFQVFRSDMKNGILTSSTYLAEKELLSQFFLEEVIEMSEEHKELHLNTEQLHVLATQKLLKEEILEKTKEIDKNISKDIKIILATIKLLNDNGYETDKNLLKDIIKSKKLKIQKKNKEKEENQM